VCRSIPIVAIVLALASCAISITTGPLHDDRIDRTVRPKGAAAIIGDSVGLGVVQYGGLWTGLRTDGFGPVRSFSVLGMHAAPESSTDVNTVARWINTFRAEGLKPKVVAVIAGSNDVGYRFGTDVAHDVIRIEKAMAALGTVPVVWTTISHPNVTGMNAWNAALAQVASRHPNLKVCDWATQLKAHPSYLARDKVHMTLGATGGYVAMQAFIRGCVAKALAPAVAPPKPPPTTAPASTTTTTTVP
jgi:hypothetical protein